MFRVRRRCDLLITDSFRRAADQRKACGVQVERQGITPTYPRVFAAEPSYDVRELIRIVRRRKSIVIGTVTLVLALAVFFLSQITPTYRAEALVMVESRKANIADLREILSDVSANQETTRNEIEVIRSRTLARRVIDQLGLAERDEFKPSRSPSLLVMAWKAAARGGGVEESPPATEGSAQAAEAARALDLDEVVDTFLRHLDVRPTKASRVISVRFRSHDPQLAAEIANAVVDTYTNRFIETKIAMAGKATSWLHGQVSALREAVARSEKAVEAFRSQSGLLRGSQVTLISEEISEINRRLAAASADRAQATATLNEVRALQKASNIEAAQAITESPVIQQLRIQEAAVLREFAELTIELGERHPKVINKKSELENFRAKIDAEMERVLKSYSTAVSVATAREESLERELSKLKSKQALANSREIELRELEREAEANRKLLDTFMTRLKETTPQLDSEMQVPGATVLSPAAVPLRSLPDKVIVLAVSTVISLLLGFGLALMAERLDYGFRNAEQVTEATGLPVLAHLPAARGGTGGPDAAILDSQPSLLLEGIRSTYIQLALRSKRPAIRSLLVTSSMPKEGKTTLAIGLTRARATAGHRALLIDADLRRPSVHIRLKLQREPGLVDLLVGDASLEQILQRDEPTGAFVIASGSTARDPSDLLGSNAFKSFLDQACATFDFVVLDSSPLMSVSDACNLAPLAEETVFVIQWGKTGREVVKLALEKLTETEGVPRGVVLSRVDTAKIKLYGYGDAAYYDRTVREYYTRGSA